ncbi:protein translocase subunit SecF [Clostridia bacterium]|nr:protein translocase subunit SecF [Clostridia bacterium]
MKFIENRKKWYIFSAVIIIVGLISMMIQGLNYGIDFTGGNMLDLSFNETTNVDDLRSYLDTQGFRYNIQEAGENKYILRTEELDETASIDLIDNLTEEFGEVTVDRNEKVSASIGEELTRNALLALGIAAILMIIYITIRFEFFFGIAAVLALVHDVLITVGIFSILQIEVNSAFVAALLTIIGYSINDSIVIFDRIRENLNKRMKRTDEQIVDLSINQTLFRSISTSVAVIIVLLSLFLVGGSTIHDFVLAMLIGTVFGGYSSIFIASPLWIDMAGHKKIRK